MERSAKRKATEQLDSDKFKREEAEEKEEEEEPQSVGGTWQRASQDVLQTRKVVKAKRKGATTPPKETSEPAKASIADKIPSFWAPSETESHKDAPAANLGFSWSASEKKEEPSAGSSDFKWSFSTTPAKEADKEKPSSSSSDFKWSFSTAPAPATETKEAETEKSSNASSEFKWSFSPTSTMPSFSQKFDYVPHSTASSVTKWPSFSISDNFSFGTSSSNWPSFSTPTKDNQSKEEGESASESGANTPNTLSPPEKEKPTLPPLEAVKTGEEDETTVAEARVRLYEFLKEEKTWKERCTGTLKINVNKTNKYRILMRTDNALRVVLNALPFAGMKIEKPNTQQIKFTCMNASTQPVKLANLWIKIPSVQDTEKLYNALEKCKNSKADK